MKKNKVRSGVISKFSIDKYEICYVATDELIAYLSQDNNECFTYEDFELWYESKTDNKINFSIIIPNENDISKKVKLATLSLNNSDSRNENYAWIKIENKALYYPYSYYMGRKYSTAVNYEYVANRLGLRINNITALDIAYDSNVNMALRIKKAIRNRGLVPYVNKKAYKIAKEKIPNVLYIHKGDSVRYRDLTLVVKQAKASGMELVCYDKSLELKENSTHKTDYITDWLGWSKNIFRSELRLKNTQIKEYLLSRDYEVGQLSSLVLNEEFLFEMFYHFANRLIRFKKGKKELSIFEI